MIHIYTSGKWYLAADSSTKSHSRIYHTIEAALSDTSYYPKPLWSRLEERIMDGSCTLIASSSSIDQLYSDYPELFL